MLSFLFFCVLVLLPMGRLLNYSFLESARKTAPLSPLDLILPLLLCGYILRRLASKRLPFLRAPHALFILGFIGWALLSLFVNSQYYGLNLDQTVFSGLYLARWVAYASLYFAAIECASNNSRTQTILQWLTRGCLAFCLFGILQAAFLPSFAFIVYPDARPYIDYDPQGHRLVSTLLDPNIAAGYILIFALLSLSFYLHGFKRWRSVFLICVVALILTLSRGGATAFLAGLLVIITSRKLRYSRLIITVLVVVIVALSFYPILRTQIEDINRFSLSDPSAMSRVDDWKLALQMIEDNPVFGIGYNTFGFVSSRYRIMREGGSAFGLAGDLFLIVVLTGLVGLLLYGMIVRGVFANLRRLRAQSHNAWDRAFAVGVRAATAGVIVGACFTSLLLYPQTMAVLWILWGLATQLLEVAKNEQRVSPPVAVARFASSLQGRRAVLAHAHVQRRPH